AETPARGGLVAVAAAAPARDEIGAVLARVAVLAGVGREARADGARDHALAFLVAEHRAAQLLDHADGLVADGEPLGDRVLALEDMDVGAADRGGGDAH